MDIQRDVRDNKIQRNLAGEILKAPPIISLDSTYGVEKDGSNLVSAWKDENMPFKFNAPNVQPIENGNGIEFDGNDNMCLSLNSDSWHLNDTKAMTVYTKVKYNGAGGVICGRHMYGNTVDRKEWLNLPTQFSVVDSNLNVFITTSLGLSTEGIYETWWVVKAVGTALYMQRFYIFDNGDLVSNPKFTFSFSGEFNTSKNNIDVGAISDSSTGGSGFNGNIYAIKILPYAVFNIEN